MPNWKRHFHTKSRSQQVSMNSYKPASRLTTKSGQIRKPVMLYHERKEASSPLHQAPALVHTLVPWIYPGPDTALRSEDLSLTKKRNAAAITTYVYTAAPQVIGPPNALTRDLEGSHLPPLLLLPPRKEVCLFPFLLFLFCLPFLSPLPKSSMRQKTKFRCS